MAVDLGLRGRVSIVTGASSGIGRTIAVAFGLEGARVAVSFCSHRAGAETAAEMIQAARGEALSRGAALRRLVNTGYNGRRS